MNTLSIAILILYILIGAFLAVLISSLTIKKYLQLLLLAAVHVGVWYFLGEQPLYHLQYHMASILVCFTLWAVLLAVGRFGGGSGRVRDRNWSVRFPLRNGSILVVENIRRGMVIFGSAGSGKTESGFVPIIKHAAEHSMPCLCYDYKNGELTEIAQYFFYGKGVRFITVIPHDPERSDRINPFSPRYLQNEMQLRQQTKNIFANLRQSTGAQQLRDQNFFDKIPESTLAAVIWRLKEDYPLYCSLPHAIAFCLVKTPDEISAFVDQNYYARALGTPLRDSLKSENQIAGVKASLTLPLTDLALPTLFYVLTEDEGEEAINLDINNPSNPTFLSVVNDPNLEKVNASAVSLIISTVINSMQKRHMLPSFLLFDEGTTFTLDNISRIPATMRSFNIATVFSTQDKALSKENYGDVRTSSLLANLSYQMIGKANDPDSVKYYKQISEEIEKKTLSKSYSDGIFGSDTRKSESTRETSKYKNQDFTSLKEGQFFMFADGKDRLYDLAQTQYQRIPLMKKRIFHPDELIQNFQKIFNQSQSLT
jgi:type IV secretory pathway TraG/TraD family ATPase VirD4